MKPADVAQLYLNYRSGVDTEPQELTQEQATELQKSVGGEKEYNTMLQWASKNFDEAEISRYDKVMESGDPDAAYFAVQALAAKYNDGVGVEGKMLTGKPAKSENEVLACGLHGVVTFPSEFTEKGIEKMLKDFS